MLHRTVGTAWGVERPVLSGVEGVSLLKIKQGDTVEVIRGEDVGMRGTVRIVDPRENRIIVEGVNIAIKHQRPIPAGRQQTQGGRIEVESSIDASKVMLICPSCQERTRVGYAHLGAESEGQTRKVRVCKKCSAEL
jgi:large subunit ribosomal protein L24